MTSKIPIKEFQKIELKVGKILEVKEHPNADKLYVLKVELGEKEPRQIVAGLRPYYKNPAELINRKGIFAANLEPAVIRGIESNGMILAADDGKGSVVFLTPKREVAEGKRVEFKDD